MHGSMRLGSTPSLGGFLQRPFSSGYSSFPSPCRLIVDAMRKANVARFINHSCSPNLSIQPVFARKARNLFLYYVALFADKRIPAGQELTYSYGTDMTHVKSCRCGAENCVSKTSVDPSEEPAGEALAGEAGGS